MALTDIRSRSFRLGFLKNGEQSVLTSYNEKETFFSYVHVVIRVVVGVTLVSLTNKREITCFVHNFSFKSFLRVVPHFVVTLRERVIE